MSDNMSGDEEVSDNLSGDEEVPIGHNFSQLFIYWDTKKTEKRRYIRKCSRIKTGTWAGAKTVLKKIPLKPDAEQLENLKRLQQLKRKKEKVGAEKQISDLKRKKELVAKKQFTCEDCEKSYTRQYTLDKHMKMKHGPLKK